MRRAALPLLLCAAAATAKPPRCPGYARFDELTEEAARRVAAFEEREAFEKKSRWEKIVILFRRGETVFEPEKKKLTGDWVVEQVLKEWPAVRQLVVGPDVAAVLAELEAALEERFARGVEIDKKARRAAARELVKLLTDDFPHVRRTAIESLKKMYRNTGLLYQPDAPPADRRNKQRDWERYIKKK